MSSDPAPDVSADPAGAPGMVTPTQARAALLAVAFHAYGGEGQPDPNLQAVFVALAAALAEHAPPCDATAEIRDAAPADWLPEWRPVAARLLGLPPPPESQTLPALPRLRELLRAAHWHETKEAGGDPIAEAMGDAIRFALARCP